MSLKIFMLLILIISGMEIFLNIITLILNRVISVFSKNYSVSQNTKNAIKIITVIIFMISVIYFLFEAVKVLASWFGIPLDMRILELF